MYLLRIAVRNLFRRRTRTLVIGGILAIAVVFFLLMESLMIAMMDTAFENVIDFETPHIEVGLADFFDEADNRRTLPLNKAFSMDGEIENELKQVPGFEAKTAVLDFSAEFIAGRYDFPVQVRAIEPDTFGDVFRHEQYLVEGSFVEPGEPGVVIGSELARYFQLDAGDFFTLRFQDREGSFNTMEGEVKGIISTPHHQVNLGTVFAARDQAVPRLRLDDDAVHRWMIRLEDRGLAQAGAQHLASALVNPQFEVRSYRDASEMLVSMELWGYIETYFILGLFLMVGIIGIVAAVILSALERVEEIGMMKALGLREREIVGVFLFEGGGIGVVGGLIGCAVGAVAVGLFAAYGFDMGYFMDIDALAAVPMGDTLYGAWSLRSFVFIFAVVVLAALVSSVVPSYWASKKDPIEAIQHR